MKIVQLNRRDFLKSSALMGSGLTLGLSGFTKLATADTGSALPPYLRIAPDGGIHLGVPSSEMGQGSHTGLAMLLAEELEIEMTQIHSVKTIHHPDFKNVFIATAAPAFGLQITGYSTTIRTWYKPFRELGATARELLISAAALKWKVPVEECLAKNGRILHSKSSLSLGYGELARVASRIKLPKNPKLKSPKQFRLLGKSVARLDTLAKVNGTAVFGTDVDLPGMLYGTVRHCKVFGEKLISVYDTKAKAVPGVISVIPLEDQVVVVADSTWAAMKGADVLKLVTTGGHKDLSDEIISRQFRSDLSKSGVTAAQVGDSSKAIAKAKKVIELEYEMPMQAHATMEPLCATASVNPDECNIWAPVQNQDAVMGVAMAVTNLPPEKIKINTTFLGGGFGRKFEVDFLVAPLVASKVMGKPVKVIWKREEDTRNDFFRPPTLAKMRIGLDSTGLPVALDSKLVSPSLNLHLVKMLGVEEAPNMYLKNGYDYFSVEGMFDPFSMQGSYEIPNLNVDYVQSNLPISLGYWRSVGMSHNIFALESAIDEAASAGGNDPLELRRTLLNQKPRALKVLDKVAELSHWGNSTQNGRFRGIGFLFYHGGFQAQVAEVSISNRGKIKVHNVIFVADCGQIINPSLARQQVEGSILFGLNATLKGEINAKNGEIVQSNFDDYPMIKLRDTPNIKIHFIESQEFPAGIGEIGTPLIGPVVANAVFAATGKRVRRLPIRKKDLV